MVQDGSSLILTFDAGSTRIEARLIQSGLAHTAGQFLPAVQAYVHDHT